MGGFIVIFSLAIAGSFVCLSTHLLLKFFALKTQDEPIAMDLSRGESAVQQPRVDPVLAFGFITSSYGAIALTLISALPGDLALERTILAFALLCVGGLVGEIARTATLAPTLDEAQEQATERKPIPLRLLLCLTVTLNLIFAVLSSAQGLIEIVPPSSAGNAARTEELQPIVVVAQRTRDPLNLDL